MDGYEVTRQIKADPALRSIPIIAAGVAQHPKSSAAARQIN
jgi:CheY-like chemotaxis protein